MEHKTRVSHAICPFLCKSPIFALCNIWISIIFQSMDQMQKFYTFRKYFICLAKSIMKVLTPSHKVRPSFREKPFMYVNQMYSPPFSVPPVASPPPLVSVSPAVSVSPPPAVAEALPDASSLGTLFLPLLFSAWQLHNPNFYILHNSQFVCKPVTPDVGESQITYREEGVFVWWLQNVPATCKCISGTGGRCRV